VQTQWVRGLVFVHAGGYELGHEVVVVGVEIHRDAITAEGVCDTAAGAQQGVAITVNAFELRNNTGLVFELRGVEKLACF